MFYFAAPQSYIASPLVRLRHISLVLMSLNKLDTMSICQKLSFIHRSGQVLPLQRSTLTTETSSVLDNCQHFQNTDDSFFSKDFILYFCFCKTDLLYDKSCIFYITANQFYSLFSLICKQITQLQTMKLHAVDWWILACALHAV